MKLSITIILLAPLVSAALAQQRLPSRDRQEAVYADFCNLVLAPLVSAALAQLDPAVAAKPGSLEALASRTGTHVIWSNEVGRLDSGNTHAVFTTLAVEDPAQPARNVRGLQVALSLPDWKGTRYLEETELLPLKKKLDELAAGARRFPDFQNQKMMISTICPGDKENLPLTFGYYNRGFMAGPPVLLIGGPGLPPDVEFVGATPSQLVEIFAKALDEMRTR